MTELNKLAVMLARADIPFVTREIDLRLRDGRITRGIVYSRGGEKKIVAITYNTSHKESYCDLIEIWKSRSNSMTLGILSAEEAFEWFKDGNRGVEENA